MIRTTSRGRRAAAEAETVGCEIKICGDAMTRAENVAEAAEAVEAAETVAAKRHCFSLGAISALHRCPEGKEDEMANAAQMLMHIFDHEARRPVLWTELAEGKAQESGDTDRSLAILEECLSGHDVLNMLAQTTGGNGLYKMHEIRRKFERVFTMGMTMMRMMRMMMRPTQQRKQLPWRLR